MRFIVQEQRYEQPLASGRFVYRLEGEATGAVESWRLSQATAGYQFLRVDLDARQAASGHSYLFHLVRQDNGRPERLAYRLWTGRRRIEGTLLFSEQAVTGTRAVDDTVFEEDLELPSDYGFWFPSAAGLGLIAFGEPGIVTAVSLDNRVHEADGLALQLVEVRRTREATSDQALLVARQKISASGWSVAWANAARHLLLDDDGWPLKMTRDDGLTAVETQYIRYRI